MSETHTPVSAIPEVAPQIQEVAEKAPVRRRSLFTAAYARALELGGNLSGVAGTMRQAFRRMFPQEERLPGEFPAASEDEQIQMRVRSVFIENLRNWRERVASNDPTTLLARGELRSAVFSGRGISRLVEEMRDSSTFGPIFNQITTVAEATASSPSEIVEEMRQGGRYETVGNRWRNALETEEGKLFTEQFLQAQEFTMRRYAAAVEAAKKAGVDPNYLERTISGGLAGLSRSLNGVPSLDPADMRPLTQRIRDVAESAGLVMSANYGPKYRPAVRQDADDGVAAQLPVFARPR